MKKIALFSLLNIKNCGEQFICDCTKYLIGKEPDAEVQVCQLEPPMDPLRKPVFELLRKASKLFKGTPMEDKMILAAVRLQSKGEFEKILGSCDAVVIGAGSYKYGTQRLWADDSVLIEAAQKYGVPVMFSAVNVQQYDAASRKCRCLADHSSYDCVRKLTTRDMEEGLRKLREDYRIDAHVDLGMAGDPAFWLPECYGIRPAEPREVIGVNVINGRNFRAYGGSLTEEQVLDLYCGLLRELDRKHLNWELFTNGMPVDQRFAERILERMGKPELPVTVPDSAEDAVRIICGYKTLLGARLHTCICAYAHDIPFAGLYWDEKLIHFAKMAKIEDLFFTEAGMEADKLADKLAGLYRSGYSFDRENREFWKEQTRAALSDFIRSVSPKK